MEDTEEKILKVLHLLENKRKKFTDEKFLEYCKVVKKNILKAFEDRNLSKEKAKYLLKRINNLLEIAGKEEAIKQIYKENIKICPNCGTKNKINANFCRKCGHSLEY